MSDVGVGVLLSGGLDSTAIVALLGEHASSVPTFTVGFPGHEIADERAEARRVAKLYGTDHHEITLSDEEALAVLPRLIAHQDEPIADPVCVPTFAVCGLARENGIKVVLAGEGADELFWGYHGYQGMIERWPRYRLALAAPRLLRRFTPALASGERRPHRKEQLEGLAEGRVRPVHFPVGMTRWQRSRILQHQLGAGWEPSPRGPGEDPLSTFAFDTQEYEFDVRLPELLLMRVDRYSMANSVEARVPFLDPVLVDYVYSLPLEQKVRNGVTKFSLKNAVADIVPPEVSNRRKQGFAAPASQWFAGDHGRMLSQLVAKGAMQRYFDASRVAQIAREAARGHWWAGQVLWPIFNFALWHRHWIEGEDIEPEAILAARRSAVGIEGRQ